MPCRTAEVAAGLEFLFRARMKVVMPVQHTVRMPKPWLE